MMLCEVISPIGGTRSPKDVKLPLAHTIADPIKMHVNGFGLLLLDCVIGDATGGAVVHLEWHGWLHVPQFLQSCSDGANCLCIEE